jgi:hypothetical protein
MAFQKLFREKLEMALPQDAVQWKKPCGKHTGNKKGRIGKKPCGKLQGIKKRGIGKRPWRKQPCIKKRPQSK